MPAGKSSKVDSHRKNEDFRVQALGLRRLYTPKVKQKMIKIYLNSDITLRELAQQSGIAWYTLQTWMAGKSKIKSPVSVPAVKKGKIRRKYSDELKEEAREMHRQENMTLIELSKKLDVPQRTLYDWIFRTNEEKDKVEKHSERNNQYQYTLKQKKQACEMYSQGNRTIKQLSQELGLPTKTLERWVRGTDTKDSDDEESDSDIRSSNSKKMKKTIKNLTDEEKEEVCRMYLMGKSQNEIARKFNICQATVSYWCRNQEIKDKVMKKSRIAVPVQVAAKSLQKIA